MAGIAPPGPTAVDNAPGGATCPPWLYLLDDPAPRRVVFVGTADEAAAGWFADAGADVELHAHPGAPSGEVDLLVVSEPGIRLRRPRGLAAFLAACLVTADPRQAVVVPWALRESTRADLERQGFTTIRPLASATGPGGRPLRRPGGGYVALRGGGRTPDGTGGEADPPPPAWLADLAGGQSWAPGPGGWSLTVPQVYPSQKAVVRLRSRPAAAPTAVVKVVRHPRFNARLENEAARLCSLPTSAPAAAARSPGVLGSGTLAGLAFVVEGAVAGRPFLETSALTPDCALAADAVAAIGDLLAPDHRTVGGDRLAERLDALLARFVDREQPPAPVSQFLERQIRSIGASRLPAAVFHGDLGTWNLLEHEGSVRILDWESAEDPGPPLWDLAYFTRSYLVRAGRRRGLDRDRAVARHLIGASGFNRAAAGWFADYAGRAGLGPDVVEALFHTTWLHRAVKEADRLGPGRRGHYGPLCTRLVLAREEPGIRALVGR